MIPKSLEKTKKLVWPEIQKYLKDPIYPSQFKIPKDFQNDAQKYWDINKVYPERKGKYLRPTLVRLIADALGNKSKNVIKLAAAMQLSEEWILIHDDIEDKSDERRGGPSLNKMYGTELAINAGDALHTIMWKMVNDLNLKEISDEFYTMILRTTLGQGVEMTWNGKKTSLDEKKYFFIADSKSSYYSIAGPMRLGAIVSGVNSKQLAKITDFGLYLGRCFQLKDDLLDENQDRLEKKETLVTTKGVKYVQKLIEENKKKALQIFNNNLDFLINKTAKNELEELINFVIKRKN